MSVKQVNIFLENKSGSLAKITDILQAEDIDIMAMVLADTADYGILRLIVSDADKAVATLRDKGIIAKTTGITVVRMQNVRGGLSAVLSSLQKKNIAIEYMYAFVAVGGKEAYAALRFEDKDAALAHLAENNIPIMTEDELR